MTGMALKKKEVIQDPGNGKPKYKPGEKSKWGVIRLNREIEDLPRKVALAKAGVPINVKGPVVAYIRGESLKKIELDRQKNRGLKFTIIDGMVFYPLVEVLKSLEG